MLSTIALHSSYSHYKSSAQSSQAYLVSQLLWAPVWIDYQFNQKGCMR